MIAPGTPLLAAMIARVLADHGEHSGQRGAVLVDPD